MWQEGAALRRHREARPLERAEQLPAGVLASTALIGHCRLASSPGAGAKSRHGIQPLRAGAGFLAHNGNLHDYRDLATTIFARDPPAVDSQVLAWIAGERPWPLEADDELDAVVTYLGGVSSAPTPLALAAIEGGRVAIFRSTHPLHVLRTDGGTYVSSRYFHDQCEPLKNKTALLL